MPDLSSLHIDQFLTNISVMYRNSAYVGLEVYPEVPVDKRSDRWPIYGKENLRRRENRRAKTALAAEVNWTLTNTSYFAEEHSLRTLVTDEEVQIADQPIRPEMDAAELLADQIMLGTEYDIAARAVSTAVVTNNANLATGSGNLYPWSDYTNGAPLTNIRDAKNTVRQNVLNAATHMMVPYENATVLADHPSIKDLTKYTDPAGLMETGLPSVVRGLRIIEASALYDSANEGAATSLSTVWGNTALIFMRAAAPGLRQVSFAYTFVAPDVTSGVRGMSTRRYRDDPRKGVWIETSTTYVPVEIAATGAYLYINVR